MFHRRGRLPPEFVNHSPKVKPTHPHNHVAGPETGSNLVFDPIGLLAPLNSESLFANLRVVGQSSVDEAELSGTVTWVLFQQLDDAAGT